MSKRAHKLIVLTLAASALAASGAAMAQNAASGMQQGAQDQQQAPAMGAQTAPAADISDADVSKFTKANKKVMELNSSYGQELQEHANDPQKSAEIQQQAQDEMIQAVQDQGLSIDKYNQIAQAAQVDPELRKRIEAQD